MKATFFYCLKPISFALVLLAVAAFGQPPVAGNSAEKVVIDRVGDTAFLRLRAPSFEALTPRQQALAYWLVQASIAIDPIIYDQFSSYGLRQKRMLEEILAHDKGIDPATRAKIADYAKLFWANRGNHNDITSQKFVPGFTFEELVVAASSAHHNGGFRTSYADLAPLKTEADVKRELADLRASLFDPAFEPMEVAKSPAGGKDVIQASSNTFYPGLSLEDLKGFQDKYALNSRVVRGADGKLRRTRLSRRHARRKNCSGVVCHILEEGG